MFVIYYHKYKYSNMEVIIPLVAVGGLYLISNQSKLVDSFRNKNSELPNTDIPNKNYPDEYPIQNVENDLTSRLSHDNRYDNKDGVFTDRFFDPASEKDKPGNDSTNLTYYSMTGEAVNANYFTHTNIQPFFGSKSYTNNDPNARESTLDHAVGAGSQYISKSEQSPFFAPATNNQWTYGCRIRRILSNPV